MPLWTPEPEWQGQDVFIIGGGPSLKGFNYGLLKGSPAIACNAAYELGPKIATICLFGDIKWLRANYEPLSKSPNKVVSVSPHVMDMNIPFLWMLTRQHSGIHKGNDCGWNYSTGAAAVNLAANLGAARVFLLGFDMKPDTQGETHWHNRYAVKTCPESFGRHLRGFTYVEHGMQVHYPQVQVYNVTNGSSHLPGFNRVTVAEMEKLRS